MATYSVTAGEISTGITLNASDVLYVFSGGSTLSTTVGSGGIEGVFSGGSASDTIVSGGGELIVLPDGGQTGTMLSGGAIVSTGVVLYQPASGFTVEGARASNLVVRSGAIEYVLTGGTAIDTTVNDGGAATVFGTVSEATVNDGATETLSGGGTASFTTVNASGAQTVDNGGTAISTAVNGGGTQDVNDGGSAVGALVDGGFQYLSFGGTTVSTTVNDGGLQAVYYAATASDTTVNSGATEAVFSGATISTTVNDGGFEGVFSGGAVSETAVSSGGTLIILPGGTDDTPHVLAGGAIVSTGVVLYQPTSGFTVYGSHANGVFVGAGATEFVLSSGTAISTLVSSGGYVAVYSGGTVSFATVSSGTEYLYSGGTASFTTVDSGGGEVVAGPGTDVFGAGLAVSTTVNGGGYEVVSSGGTASFATVNGNGTQYVDDNGTAVGTIVDAGVQRANLNGTTLGTMVNSGGAEYVAGIARGTTVDNGGTEFVYAGGTAVSTTVNSGGHELVSSGFSIVSFTSVNLGGAIDVANLPYASGGSASVNSTTDMLTVSVGGQGYTQQLAGDYTDIRFQLGMDTGSGTLVTADVRCYRNGTRILTDRGEVAVEDLRVGERVRTMLGAATAPIIWIGRREVDCTRHAKPWRVWPVRVAAGAFGPGRPGTDLFLSPDHAVYVSEVLIPIRHLVNGTSISQVPVDRVVYYHLELARHDVVLAQGLPAESFLDMRDGTNYANGRAAVRAYPDFSARMWEAFGCARLVVTGPELVAALALVARCATTRDAA